MKSLLRFTPSIVPINYHPQEQRHILQLICFALFVASLLLTILFSFLTQANIGRMSQLTIRMMPITAVFYLILLILIQKGLNKLVSHLIIFQLSTAFSLTAATSLGIHDPVVIGFFLLLVIAALLFGSNAVLISAIISILIFFGLFFGEIQGWIITDNNPTDTFVELISLSIALGLTAVILQIVMVTLNDALQESQDISNSLRESEEKWSSLMTHTHSLVLTLDMKAQVKSVNHPPPHFKNTIDIPVYVYFQKNQQEKIERMLDSVHKRGEAIRFEAMGHTNKDAPTNYEVQIGPIQRDNQMIGLILIARDITERREIEQAVSKYAEDLARSNHDLEEFAYIASHDLQEPLRMISSYLTLLQKKHAANLNEEANEFIETAVNGAKRLRQLIHSLLAYSRIGRTETPKTPVDCAIVISNTLRYLQLAIEDHNAEIIVGNLPTVSGDDHQIGTLFQNLISNALKFHSDQPPKIEIQANQTDDGMWQFSVSDNGIGMKPKHTKRIFTIFQRLHTIEEYPGTGVGLAICKKIIDRHNGRIWVKSKPGKGATFFFTLPAPIGQEQ